MKIQRTESVIIVVSEYSPDLPRRARAISGKWDAINRNWIYPLAAEPQVRDLYKDIYGEWDDVPTNNVSLLCTCEKGAVEYCGSLTLGGRVIAWAYGKRSGARTGNGVIVVHGGFKSGGSWKNWYTGCQEGTVFRLLYVPKEKADALVAKPEWCGSIIIETEIIKSEALTLF